MIPPLNGLDAWLAAREAEVPALRSGCEKRVTWAGDTERTPWSVVYIQGFSASRREVSPYPERLARGLSANFLGTRLIGHGQDGPAMNRASLRDWRADLAEALAIGRALGERVLADSCSTGSTLLTLALACGEVVAGAVMISPNYGLSDAPAPGRAGRALLGALGAPCRTRQPGATGCQHRLGHLDERLWGHGLRASGGIGAGGAARRPRGDQRADPLCLLKHRPERGCGPDCSGHAPLGQACPPSSPAGPVRATTRWPLS